MQYQSVKTTTFGLLNNNLNKHSTKTVKRQAIESQHTPVDPSQSPLLSWRNWKQLRSGHLPGQVIIQLTDQCNASCSQCGMRRENKFTRSTLAVDDIKRMLDAMAERGVVAVSFTGGEPLLYLNQLEECVRHARSVGIRYIRTGTNGFMFRNHERPEFQKKVHELAGRLATSGLYTFWISIDSAFAEIHEKNRGLPNSIAGIEKALPIFHEHGLYPSSNLGINRYLGGVNKAPDISGANGAPKRFINILVKASGNFTATSKTWDLLLSTRVTRWIWIIPKTTRFTPRLPATTLFSSAEKKNCSCFGRCSIPFRSFAIACAFLPHVRHCVR